MMIKLNLNSGNHVKIDERRLLILGIDWNGCYNGGGYNGYIYIYN